jgi:hypothetical protein
MINLKNDMVKNIQKLNKKQIPAILALKKPSRYNSFLVALKSFLVLSP